MSNVPNFCDTEFGIRNSNEGINGGMIETNCAHFIEKCTKHTDCAVKLRLSSWIRNRDSRCNESDCIADTAPQYRMHPDFEKKCTYTVKVTPDVSLSKYRLSKYRYPSIFAISCQSNRNIRILKSMSALLE